MSSRVGLGAGVRAVVAGLDSVVGTAPLGVEVTAILARWRRGGLALAIVADRPVPAGAGTVAAVARHVDTIVEREPADREGEVEGEGEGEGEGESEAEAVHRRQAALTRLGVPAREAVAVESEVAGVAAARRLGFACVIAVERAQLGADSLARAGADRVVRRLARVRFPRRLPSALERLSALREQLGERPIALFLDFDGTLTPIVRDPTRAHLDAATRARLARLAERQPVVVLSGRDRADVEARVGLPGLIYVGSHGLDIAGPGLDGARSLAEVALAEAARPRLAEAGERLQVALAAVPGVVLERKRFGLAVHYRQVVGEPRIEAVRRVVDAVAEVTGLRPRCGKQVRELVPVVAWDKGRALDWIVEARGLQEHALVVVGDDETDEDAFAQVHRAGRVGVGIRVGRAVSCSLADYRVESPSEVRALLDWLRPR